MQSKELALLNRMNQRHLAGRRDDSDLAARMYSFEAATGLQSNAPEVLDFSDESDATFDLYGIQRDDRKSFGWQCMAARRMSERGVRFIEIVDKGNWDAHSNMKGYRKLAQNTDKAIAGLLTDLKQRGLLEKLWLSGAQNSGERHRPRRPNWMGVIIIRMHSPAGSQAAESKAAPLQLHQLPRGRGEVIEAGGLTIINDAYNANPARFLAAIATPRAMRGTRRLVFVAGTMRELGADAARHHAGVAAALVGLEPDLLAAVGEFVPVLQLYASRLGDRLLVAPDAPTMGPLLKARLVGDELVVLKASRGAALERILPFLTGPHHPTH